MLPPGARAGVDRGAPQTQAGWNGRGAFVTGTSPVPKAGEAAATFQQGDACPAVAFNVQAP